MVLARRIWKSLRWVVVVIMLALAAFVIVHPPIVRWAIREYSPEYTGRRITVESFRINPINGVMRIEGLKIMEAEGDSLFLGVDRILVNATLYKMFGGLYEITALHVEHPELRIVQSGSRFNFSDLSDRFMKDTPEPEQADTLPVHYALYDVRVDSASLSYKSHLLPYPMHVAKADVHCPRVAWNIPLIEVMMNVLLDNGTLLDLELDYDQVKMLYGAEAKLKDAPCRMMVPYVEPYMRIGGLEGSFHADVSMRGDANDPMGFSLKGRMGVEDFALSDPNGAKLTGLKELDVVIDTLDVANEQYRVRRLVFNEPYILAELYDEGDNFTKWLVADSTATTSAAEDSLGYDPENPFSMLTYYVEEVAKNYATMSYRMDSLGVVNGTVLFNDYSLQEPFRYAFTELSLRADNINSKADMIRLFAHSKLNTNGTFDAMLGLDPTTLRNMRLEYTMEDVGMPDFAPYTVFYVAHPILSGRTRYVCNTTIVDNKLQSVNQLFVEDFAFGKKMKVADAMNLPMRLAVSLMKDKDGNIDLTVPVEGDLDDPEYKVWPIIWQVIKNIFVKAINAPVTLLSRAFDADEEDLRAVRFLPLQAELSNQQEKPLNILARVASEKPDIGITLIRSGNRDAEAEAYAIRVAKASYFADSTGTPPEVLDPAWTAAVDAVDIKSVPFKNWLDKAIGPSTDPVQERCIAMVGMENALAEVDRLSSVRSNLITEYLVVEKAIQEGAILIRDHLPTDTVPAGGQPAYHVVFGERDLDAAATAPLP
ncbi:MAG: DUF748 domain-containing protein [Flavobacteriales bacterium]|nr:DUF748 domain-containing protein [Flavobacteriales bacterium]